MKEDNKSQRDMQKQAQYREALTKESIKIYGVARCFASKKQYKGLIASHIKPYMLCVLEGDELSQFDPDNGLLLAKFIDDYFDKLLLSFDEEGNMIFSDVIPDEVKDEFQHYSLGNEIYNDKRKQYMQIHRSLFYYKNYMRHSDSDKKKLNLSIPYVDCGIRVYKGKSIIQSGNKWEILPTFHLKSKLAEQAKGNIKFDAYASGAEVLSAICQNDKYVLTSIPDGFNTPHKTLNVFDSTVNLPENDFKLCSTNYDVVDSFPAQFYDFLACIMRNESDVDIFRKIVAAALRNEKIEKHVIINGAEASVESLLYVMKNVLGSYVAEISSSKHLKADNPLELSIPNCRLLFCNLRHKNIPATVMDDIAENRFFVPTVLNVDRYLPLFCCSGKNAVDNSIIIELKKDAKCKNIDELVEEGGEILNWFLAEQDTYIDYSTSISPVLSEGCIKEWFYSACEYTNDSKDKCSATSLFNSYCSYIQKRGNNPVTMKKFCIELQQYANKKRAGAGIFYVGLRIKTET